MVKVGRVLPRLLFTQGLSRKIKEHQVLVKWGEAVGHPVASHTSAVALQRGQLHVRVDHPIWSHQLSMLKATIITKLNTWVGEPVVSDIRFTS